MRIIRQPVIPFKPLSTQAIGLCVACLLGMTGLPAVAAGINMRENAILHLSRGDVYYQRKKFDYAIAEYQLSLMLNPEALSSSFVYHNMGMAYRAMSQTDMAIVSFQRAVHLNPIYALFYERLAETYELANRLPQAEESIRNTLIANDSDAKAWFLLGCILNRMNRQEEARDAFGRFLKIEPFSELAIMARKKVR